MIVKLRHNGELRTFDAVRSIRERNNAILRLHLENGEKVRYPLAEVRHVRVLHKKGGKRVKITA